MWAQINIVLRHRLYGVIKQVIGVYQFDPEPDHHFQFFCEHVAWYTCIRQYRTYDGTIIMVHSHRDTTVLRLDLRFNSLDTTALRLYCDFSTILSRPHCDLPTTLLRLYHDFITIALRSHNDTTASPPRSNRPII